MDFYVNNQGNMQILERRIVLGKQFEIYGTKENPYFLAKDVANWIEHNKPSEMIKNIDVDEKELIFVNHGDSIARVLQTNTEYWFLTEDGLYEVLMQSRKPIAKKFKKEVKQILKEIRLTGGHVSQGSEEDFIKNYFPSFSENVKQAMVLDLRNQNDRLKEQIEADRPKVLYAEALEVSDECILVKEMAMILKQNGVNIGQNRLFEWLRENGYLCKSFGERKNLPTQKALDMKLFEIKKGHITRSNGSLEETKTPMITGKGQIYFINKFLGKQSA